MNHETNTVIWAAKDHGKSVLQKFCEQLPPEQRSSIKVVTSDGVRWITNCVKEYFPNAECCVDPFHVVEWATETLDKVHIAVWRRAQEAAKTVAVIRGKSRLRKDDKEAQIAAAAKKKADQIKSPCILWAKHRSAWCPIRQSSWK